MLSFEFRETSRQSQSQKIIVLTLPSELTENNSKNLMKIYQEALQSKKKQKLFQHLPKSNFRGVLKPLKMGLQTVRANSSIPTYCHKYESEIL